MTATTAPAVLPLDEVSQLSIGPAAVALGVFDGVHRGHQTLLSATREAAAARGARPVALIFDPPPVEVIRPDRPLDRLAPLEENLALTADAGVHPVAIRFDAALRELPAETFLDRLPPGIQPVAVVMTPDSAFGKDRAGTAERLAELGPEHGFEVVVIDPELDDGPISSSRVREALAAGDVETATRLLSRWPALSGTVIRGDGRGRDLGFPTANLAFDYRPALPLLGIYAGLANGIGALVSVGRRPVFHTGGDIVVEANLLDWDGDLYDKPLRIELVERLRDEREFASVSDLVAQMKRDEVEARTALNSVL
jgi:riboflavin kinase / FMN adenylyltransferase